MATNTESPMNQSFTDSAIDMDSASETVITKTPEETTTTTTTTKDVPSITQRLARLVRLSENGSDKGKNSAAASPELSRQKSMVIQQYLDGIEALLDPHGGEMGNESTIIMEDEECAKPIPPLPAIIHRPETTPPKYRGPTDVHSQLNTLMGDLNVVTTRLEQRRAESLHLNAVFTIKCEKLAQRILQLEDEIQELRAEKIENTIEMEGLKGTVRGLESWISRWKRRQGIDDSCDDRTSDYGWEWDQMRRHGAVDGEEGNDTLIDGIGAWLRGWNDVEEGFRIRAKLRKQREATRQNKGSIP
ncbi:hypothetical protein FQN53_002465 [Emmonsiellopsis sp. PD_33]|nr:hypothetical protein FQN53_002465 [Emmonsiellopsis sp. PD_33]KAK2801942.1 hypothetical protein FQN51_005091 [Onygenales sp. PD_10]